MSVLDWIEVVVFLVGIVTFGLLASVGLIHVIAVAISERHETKRLKRPKCPNGYNCGDCIHADTHWEGIKFRGFSCRINAR